MTHQIYFIRHGIAADSSLYSQDEQRPLINKGKEKTLKVAQRLKALDIEFEVILTSPLIRAYQTAEILGLVGLSSKIEKFAALAPQGNIQTWLQWYNESKYTKPIALVGHQPDLTDWAEMLIWGESQEKLVLKKAGIIGIQLPETEPYLGKSQLFWLSAPKFFINSNPH